MTVASCSKNSSSPTQPRIPAGAQIHGTVIDFSDGAPVQNAVLLVDTLSNIYHADSNGKFDLYGLSPGAHTLHVASVENDSISFSLTLTSSSDTAISINLPPLVHSDLILYLPFSSSLRDGSGMGWTATQTGGSWTDDRFNRPNHAMFFAGNNDAVLVSSTSDSEFASNQSFTAIAWVNTSTQQDSTGIVGVIRPDGVGFQLLIANNKLQFLLTTLQGGNLLRSGTLGLANLVDGNWHFIALVANRDNGFSYSIVLDSTLLNSASNPSPVDISGNGVGLTIGSNPSNGAGFIGTIDDVRLYNRSLSTAELLRLYHERGWKQ